RENELRQRLNEVNEWIAIFESTLDSAERSIGRRLEAEQGLATHEPAVINEEEAAMAPLPEDSDNWMSSQEPASSAERSTVVAETPMEVDEQPREEIRELVLRNRTICFPVPASRTVRSNAATKVFHAADVEILPDHFRRELVQSSQDAYRVITDGDCSYIICCLCERRFNTLKGWRIHASRMHRKDGFCSSCGHYLVLPSTFSAPQKEAAVELHVLDWCPWARTPIINERKNKRRRLDLVGRDDDARLLFIPGLVIK
ncbi:unnamed protein product, partial [Thelazia callipaeda]|uniref:C2H2-type domain-containing protein n=1 Tax=Thelazia callipaeda TaxID=103827 RepID=A0A0N5CTL7_THECL